jgi:lysozyme family protein
MNPLTLIDDVIGREGRYSNNPNDKGGETIWGITIGTARAFGYASPMITMPRDTAVAIYVQRYWKQPRFEDVAIASQPVAAKLLDVGVNMGPSTATKFLQRALNVLNRGDVLYPNTTVDGSIGAMTLAALDAFMKARGIQGETVLLRMLNAQQGMRYIEIAEDNPSQEEFEFGWFLNRVQ